MAHVVVFGGGVAGMSAAHELAERGLRVTVYEKNPALPGGKARSVPVPGSAEGGRPELPGEHGFRFFPGFYRHITDTMRRIPFAGNRDGVLGNLVAADEILFARLGKRAVVAPTRLPRSLAELREVIEGLFGADLGLEPGEREHFAERVWQLVTTCRDRRLAEYERQGWWQFIGAETRSPAYQTLLAEGLTRTLVAAKAREASTKTNGDILAQMLFDMVASDRDADRLLNAPTNEAWLTPWLDHLENELGVDYQFGHTLERFECDESRVVGAWVRDGQGERQRVEADAYLAAVPVEAMARVLRTDFAAVHGTDDEDTVCRLVGTVREGRPSPALALLGDATVAPTVLTLDPSLCTVLPLAHSVGWMTGLQIYLNERVPINRGHVIYADSPWALTSISQAQFWDGYDLSEVGNGRVRDVLSAILCDWDTPGLLSGRPAREAETKQEIFEDVWAQLKQSLNVDGRVVLRDDQVEAWYLDGAIEFLREPERLLKPETFLDGEDGLTNAEPLLINRVNTWTLRPVAHTAIPNLFLASDYVRTNTDLATMEGANEAARRAVNGILEAVGSRAAPCEVWPLREPWLLGGLRQRDRRRFERGLPWRNPLPRRRASVAYVPLAGRRVRRGRRTSALVS